MVTGGDRESQEGDGDLGKLSVLGGVRQFPIRVKCATLPWHALRAAAESRSEVVSTE
jgi:nitrogen fixation protein NifU and related proteins